MSDANTLTLHTHADISANTASTFSASANGVDQVNLFNRRYRNSERASLRNPTYAAAIAIIADTIGTLTVSVYEEGVLIPYHPVLEVLRKPGVGLNQIDLLTTIAMRLAHNSECFLGLNALGGRLTGFTFLTLTVEIDPTTKQVTYRDDMGNVISPDKFVHIKTGSLNGLEPQPKWELAAVPLQILSALNDIPKQHFSNGKSLASSILAVDMAGLSQEDKQRYTKVLLNAMNSGANGVVSSTGGSISSIKVANPLKDSLLVELQTMAIRDIARVFNINPQFLQLDGAVSYNSSSEAARQLLTFTIMPYIRRIEAALNDAFFPDTAATKIKFDLGGLKESDPQALAQMAQSHLGSGATINESRKLVGLPPLDGEENNTPMVSANITTTENLNSKPDTKPTESEK